MKDYDHVQNSFECKVCKRKKSLKGNAEKLGSLKMVKCSVCGVCLHVCIPPSEPKKPKSDSGLKVKKGGRNYGA